MTRLCIPTEGAGGLSAAVGEHFGRVPTYTLIETGTEAVEILDNTSEHMGGTGYPAELLAQAGIDVLLCRGLGQRAIQMLSERDIDVCTGFMGTAQEAVDVWLEGRATPVGKEEACTRHAFHDHDNHGHNHER